MVWEIKKSSWREDYSPSLYIHNSEINKYLLKNGCISRLFNGDWFNTEEEAQEVLDKFLGTKTKIEHKMMSIELINKMAEHSNEMALWGSIIHWFENMNSSVEDGSCRWDHCSLCIRRKSICDKCIINIVSGENCTEHSDTLYKKASRAHRDGNEEAWKIASKNMFKSLLDMALNPKKKEILYKVGDKFTSTANGEIFVIAHIGYNEICLLSTISYNRWIAGALVNDTSKITQTEFDIISYSSRNVKFTKMESNSK